MCSKLETKDQNLQSIIDTIQAYVDDDEPTEARASLPAKAKPVEDGDDLPAKKRKTRRGKPKRRKHYPYNKSNWRETKIINGRRQYKQRCAITGHGQALAPYNTNQFLMEDHGTKELDDKLNKSNDACSSTNPARTRDSSFSVDSGEEYMYSSPDDEEEFLIKEFDNVYESIHTERLQSLSKADLIEEYIQLESKLELLTNRLRGRSTNIAENDNEKSVANEQNSTESVPVEQFQQEINKLLTENDALRRENDKLRASVQKSTSSSSRDSESDSSDSCNSSSSSNPSPSPGEQLQVNNIDYTQTDGHSSHSPCSPSPPLALA